MSLTIRPDDLTGEAVRALLMFHARAMLDSSPPGTSYALDLTGLQAPEVTVWTAWDGAALAGVGAMKRLGPDWAELKSMRTHPDHLRRGVAQAMLAHIIAEARAVGIIRLSLETGTGRPFDAAVALYRKRGFVVGAAFAGYPDGPDNQCLHLVL